MTLKTHGPGGRLGHLPGGMGETGGMLVQEARASNLFLLQVFISTASPRVLRALPSGAAPSGVSAWRLGPEFLLCLVQPHTRPLTVTGFR